MYNVSVRITDIRDLRSMIAEAQMILTTFTLPEGSGERAHELLTAAIDLADALIEQSPAAILSAKGGKATAKRGPEYYKQVAALKKTRAGGRPPPAS
jgi:hypothetical protein